MPSDMTGSSRRNGTAAACHRHIIIIFSITIIVVARAAHVPTRGHGRLVVLADAAETAENGRLLLVGAQRGHRGDDADETVGARNAVLCCTDGFI